MHNFPESVSVNHDLLLFEDHFNYSTFVTNFKRRENNNSNVVYDLEGLLHASVEYWLVLIMNPVAYTTFYDLSQDTQLEL